MRKFTKSLLSMAIMGSVISEPALAAGESEAGNNLSTPVIWSDGVTKVLRSFNDDPAATQFTGVSVDCVDFQDKTCYVQKDADNIWQAESWNAMEEATSYTNAVGAITDGLQVDEVDWGDNLEARDWSLHAPVRVETVLWQTLGGAGNHSELPAMQAFEMSYISGQGPTEVRGTTGVLLDSTEATVYSDCARLTIQKIADLDGVVPVLEWDAAGSKWGELPVNFSGAVWEAGDGPGFYASEVNVSGKIVYGYNWNVSSNGDGTGIYRLTFSLDGTSPGGQQCNGTALNTWLGNAVIRQSVEEEAAPSDGGASDHTGGGTPVLDAANNLSYIDVTISDSGGGSGGGGGGGHDGGGGGGGGGPQVSEAYISTTGGSGFDGVFVANDTITVYWDNSTMGDNHAGVATATVDFSAMGGDSQVVATNYAGIWSASYLVNANSISGTGLTVAITATSGGGKSATGVSSASISVDATVPTLVSTMPTDGAVNVSINPTIALTFSEPVQAGSGAGTNINIYDSAGHLVESIPADDGRVKVGQNIVQVNPTALVNGTSYYLLIEAGAFTDVAGNIFAGIADSAQLDFRVEPYIPPEPEPVVISEINGTIVNTGTLTNPLIGADGVVEQGSLTGNVTSAGLIRNVNLATGTVVTGGHVAGTITGDPVRPALLNSSIDAGAILSNVVIGTGASLDPGVVLGSNVRFETLANIPSGMDLSVTLGGLPWQNDSTNVVALDISRSLLVDGSEADSVLSGIQALGFFTSSGAELAMAGGSGEFSVNMDGQRSRLVAVNLRHAEAGMPPGVSVNEDGNVRIITDDGLEVISLPVLDDVGSLRDVLSLGNNPLTLGFDANANIVVSSSGGAGSAGEFVLMGRGAILAVPADEGSTVGLKSRPLERPAGVAVNSLVYEGADGVLYEQTLVPVPANWPTLKSSLQNMSGASEVRIDARGFISMAIDGISYSALAGYRVIRGGETGPGNADGVVFSPAGDRNDDGRDDVLMHYPNGDSQILYILP